MAQHSSTGYRGGPVLVPQSQIVVLHPGQQIGQVQVKDHSRTDHYQAELHQQRISKPLCLQLLRLSPHEMLRRRRFHHERREKIDVLPLIL